MATKAATAGAGARPSTLIEDWSLSWTGNVACNDANVCTINDIVVVTGGVSQNFDGVTAPALPAGWSTNGAGAGNPWVTTVAFSSNAPNSAFTDDPATASDRSLLSPALFVQAAGAQVSFKNKFITEPGWDGGVLEISINGAAYADIITAGDSFVAGGYSGTIGTGTGSPIATRSAWTGTNTGSPAFMTTTVNLPATAVGNWVSLRWRFGSDSSVNGTGWWVDDFSTNFGGSGCAGTFQDTDADGVCNANDNCPSVSNVGQANADGDGFGDACDLCTDTDGDGFGNPSFPANTCTQDNCPR